MAVLRADIERALDDLISNEEGMRFQGLAVILAKQRWLDFVACERKKDLGADAVGSGKVLACSLTPTLGKIKSDATKAKKHFPFVTLVFATPERVTNTVTENWAAEIRKEFGCELIVISREDILTSLLNPANIALCRTHLGIPVSLEPPLEQLLQNAKEAASEVLDAWFIRLAGRPLIDLRAVTLDPEEKDATGVFRLDDFHHAMSHGQRMVLEAPAGRGKTTTLAQLANKQLGSDTLALLIDLPGWVSSGTGILQHVAGIPAFQSRGIGAEALARLQRVEQFSFLLNGWNEVAESDSIRAFQTLRQLERDFPAAGILVATRTHHVVPPLPGALRARLLAVDPSERTRYLDERLGARANELRAKLDGDGVLDELTQTPLFLSAVVDLFEAGASIPQSKIGVLESLMRLVEQSEEHSGHLQVAPLNGRASDFLSSLAASMTEQGSVSLAEESARAIVHSVAAKLRDAGQIAAQPEPHHILNALCAHHVLERRTYPPITFRFAHQQFQEFYAALLVKRQLLALVSDGDPQEISEFTKHYMNEPAWTEPLRMVANEIGRATATDPTATPAGTLLIEMALRVDLVWSAEIAYLCGISVWKESGNPLAQQLRTLYRLPDENYRQKALAGMLASGAEEFTDIVLPLLTSDDQQVRLGTYRAWPDFHVSSIGREWQTVVRGWHEEVRSEFVSELLHFGNSRELITSFALADSSARVRSTAISALVWRGSREEVTKLLESLDDETFKTALHHLPLETIPLPIRPRALAAYQERYYETADPVARIRILLLIAEVRGGLTVVDELKGELARCPDGTLQQLEYVSRPALELIRHVDPSWVSHWVAERIVEGALYADHWITLVHGIPEDMKERLLQSVEKEDFQPARRSGLIAILSAVADTGMVERIFARLCSLRRSSADTPDVRRDSESATERQLEGLFRALPVNIAVTGLSGRFSGLIDPLELTVLTRLFSEVGRVESDLRSVLPSDLRASLRGYLARGVAVILRENDFSGEQKANLASALARVGEPEDVPILRELIRADIARRQRGMQARMRGERGKLADGAAMSYANWHVRALLRLTPDSADAVLLELLKEPEYERDSAWGLVQMAAGSEPGAVFGFGFGFGKRTDYPAIWEARQSRSPWRFEEERRKRYAAAIREQIENLLPESNEAPQLRAFDFRLKELIKPLAVIDGNDSTELILKVLASQDRYNGWPVVQALDTLLSHGVVLPTTETLQIFDTLLGNVRSDLWDDQRVGLLIRAMCLLPFIENAAAGVAKVRDVIEELKRLSYQMRDLVAALGQSRCPEAVELLGGFASNDVLMEQLGEVWINAVAALDSPECRRLLLSSVDPKISGLPSGLKFYREDVLAARVAEIAQHDVAIRERIFQLCDAKLPVPKRVLLGKIMAQLGTTGAILAALNLIDDAEPHALSYEVWRKIEETFVEHKAVTASPDTYTPVPRSANSIRHRLFEMSTTDENRKNTAASLLAQIEVWRLEYGRPNGEPRNPDVECLFCWPTTGDLLTEGATGAR